MTLPLSILCLVLAAACAALWASRGGMVRRVGFLFDAIDNGDYAFSFATKGKHGADARLNRLLNRLKLVMQHARDEQMERERYYEHILASVDAGVLVADEERGLVMQHNAACARLFGRDTITHLDQIRPQMGQYALRRSPVTLRGRQLTLMVLSDIHGELARQEAESWEKLIRVLTHEVMNTLTPIIALSDTLCREAGGRQREGLQVIHKASRELTQFVEACRKAALVPAPKPTAFYVKPFLERMAALCKHGVEVEVSPDDLLVYADEGLLSRVVTNLLKNAAEAVAADGHIIIYAHTDSEERVVMDVANDGPRIPDDVAAHIFVPFFTTKAAGNGIGLSISRQIMGKMGGTIALVPYRETSLTTFRLTFN